MIPLRYISTLIYVQVNHRQEVTLICPIKHTHKGILTAGNSLLHFLPQPPYHTPFIPAFQARVIRGTKKAVHYFHNSCWKSAWASPCGHITLCGCDKSEAGTSPMFPCSAWKQNSSTGTFNNIYPSAYNVMALFWVCGYIRGSNNKYTCEDYSLKRKINKHMYNIV